MIKDNRPSVVVKPRTRSAISRNNRSRGRGLQQEVRDYILEQFPELHPDDCRSVLMSGTGEDIQLSPFGRKILGGIQIECKRVKSLTTIYKWMTQAKAHGPHKPVVITRADRMEPLVILPMSDYIDMIKRIA